MTVTVKNLVPAKTVENVQTTQYTAIGVTIPTSTTVSKMTYVGCIYNAANTRWDVIAVTTQA